MSIALIYNPCKTTASSDLLFYSFPFHSPSYTNTAMVQSFALDKMLQWQTVKANKNDKIGSLFKDDIIQIILSAQAEHLLANLMMLYQNMILYLLRASTKVHCML